MSSPSGIRHRGPKDKKRPVTPNPETVSEKVSNVVDKAKRDFRPNQGGEWDYKVAITIITILAFITRFWGINYPSQVVFDEVHFGKVRSNTRTSRKQHFRCNCKLSARLTSCAVRFVLPSRNLFLRCSPSLRKASLRIRRLASWIQGRIPF